MIIRNIVASATEDENSSKKEDQWALSKGGIAKNQIADWMAAANIHIDGDPCSVTWPFFAVKGFAIVISRDELLLIESDWDRWTSLHPN